MQAEEELICDSHSHGLVTMSVLGGRGEQARRVRWADGRPWPGGAAPAACVLFPRGSGWRSCSLSVPHHTHGWAFSGRVRTLH